MWPFRPIIFSFSPLFLAQTLNGLPTVNSYVTAPSIPPYHRPTQVSPYMGYSATTSAYVTGPTWQPASGSALSPHSCDIATPLAFKSMTANRDAIHPVIASALWSQLERREKKGDRGRGVRDSEDRRHQVCPLWLHFIPTASFLWRTRPQDPYLRRSVCELPLPARYSQAKDTQGINSLSIFTTNLSERKNLQDRCTEGLMYDCYSIHQHNSSQILYCTLLQMSLGKMG